MGKYTLYMLNPWREEGAGPYYCPDCGVVEGFLAYNPKVREQIEIINVDFARPRAAIVEAIGLENQDSPVLVLGDGAALPPGVQQSMSTGLNFINDALAICNYLGSTFNMILPHP